MGTRDTKPHFSTVRVLSQSLIVLFRNPISLLILTALVVGPGMALGTIAYPALMGLVDVIIGVELHSAFASLIDVIWSLLFYYLASAIIIDAAFQSLLGKPIGFAASFSAAFRRAGALIPLSIVCSLIVGVGTATYYFPGPLLATPLYVVVPACVVERRGLIESLRRSIELTRGHWLSILGVLFVIVGVNMVGDHLLEYGIVAELGSSTAELITMILYLIHFTFSAITTTVVYYRLRVEKEGVDADQIAQIFA